MATPSTTQIGWLLPLIEFSPRMTMRAEPPKFVEPMTFTPATLPERALTMFGVWVLFRSEPETLCAAIPRDRFSRSRPSAVTTTPSSCVVAVASRKSWVTEEPASTTEAETGVYPMRRATSDTVWPVARLAGTVKLNRPSGFVYEPTPMEGIETLAPGTGAAASLVTRPLTVVVC